MGQFPSKKENSDYIEFLNTLADAAANVTLSLFKKPVDVINKGRKLQLDYDPVTIADQNAEKVIRNLINQNYPKHNILGEEHGAEQNAALNEEQWTWVIDPIDGTRAYICGIPTWGTLVALNNGENAVIGMLDQPYLKERYVGSAEGSFLNGERISCRPCTDISDATISTTDPTQFFATEDDRKAFEWIAEKAKLTRNGYDCYAYAMVAAGFMDVVIESGLEAYDIQALIPVVEGAGGIVTTWSGGSALNGGRIVASATSTLHDQVLDILNS